MEKIKALLMRERRKIAGFLALVIFLSALGMPIPAEASEIWPQKATAPFYCLDGGKSWRQSDRYDIYKYDTLPSPLTEEQAKRLFWAYPTNWNALKRAASKYDPELYAGIASQASGPNEVKKIKDNAKTKFAWIADDPDRESRAIRALEKEAASGESQGNEAPEAIREATSEERAVSIVIAPFSDGPGALDTELVLGSRFIRDIAGIEPQSVWDNGSGGGKEGWLDASQDKNIAKSVMGESLYELTWSNDSIRIHNNGSATANDSAVGSNLSEEERYNKTMVRYKITMKKNSGWYTEGSWNEDYLHQWMDFKACVNAPEHQRLYQADIRIVPSDMVFYLVISQGEGEIPDIPGYGTEAPEMDFRIFRHKETFSATYNVKLKKLDDETGMPLRGSQFYLYERFEDADSLVKKETEGRLQEENLSFVPWEGFQIFAEGTTDERGEISHRDERKYTYDKTYCDGHGMPKWSESSDTSDPDPEADEQIEDKNRAAAKKWLELVDACADCADTKAHFHWLADENAYEEVCQVLETGKPETTGGGNTDPAAAFVASGCRADCEATRDAFIHLKFTYTWKEIKARTGYILHDIHPEDIPIELVTTTSSEAGADAVLAEGSVRDVNTAYSSTKKPMAAAASLDTRKPLLSATRSNAKKPEAAAASSDTRKPMLSATRSNAKKPEAAAVSLDTRKPLLSATRSNAKKSEAATSLDTRKPMLSATRSNAKKPEPSSSAEGSTFLSKLWRILKGALTKGGIWKPESGEEAMDVAESRLLNEEADGEWDSDTGADFETYLGSATEDGIRHLPSGNRELYSHYDAADGGKDFWEIRDHRTEGELYINKRDLDLYRKESDQYSSEGDTEGDGTLKGAVYGLFAAEDIIHPDTDIRSNGTMTNTGIVYRKHDLTSVAVTDEDGNAAFLSYTEMPGMTFDMETGKIMKRKDISWKGPKNCYSENDLKYGNYWISRPLLLGKYYVKELSRSEGYELSVNGLSASLSNSRAGTELPDIFSVGSGTAIVSLKEMAASMEGEDGGGTGYDQIPFTVSSNRTGGYTLVLSGFPENTEFYRVDSGEKEVTALRVTGAIETPVKDAEGRQVWVTAETDTDYIKYKPEYAADGSVSGQTPQTWLEPQMVKAYQIPQQAAMKLTDIDIDEDDPILHEKMSEHDIKDKEDRIFFYLKAETERILRENGYGTPITADGCFSTEKEPVYSRGVKKGQPDRYGMTTKAGETAAKTYYGAAVQEICIRETKEGITTEDILAELIGWYGKNPQWSFGGLDSVKKEQDGYRFVVYSGISAGNSKWFFTLKEAGGKTEVDKIYGVLEDPTALRLVYREYGAAGTHRYQIERQYCFGSGNEKRYYIDAVLTPAVLIDKTGKLQDILHSVMVYHRKGEVVRDYLDGDPDNGYKVPLRKTSDKLEVTTETELVETDVKLEAVSYDKKSGVYRLRVETEGTDSNGAHFSDRDNRLMLSFMAKLPQKEKLLTDKDVEALEKGNVYGYSAGDRIGYGEYLTHIRGVSMSVSLKPDKEKTDSYIAVKELVYRRQNRVKEDADTGKVRVQVLERPIKQKVKVVKYIKEEEAIGNFRFKIYLKSNLERLFCSKNGEIRWTDKKGNEINIREYREQYPELVQKIYTRKTDRMLLEKTEETKEPGAGETYNYEKFFDAIQTADTDKWKNKGVVLNTSFKPFAFARYTGTENQINSSEAARQNALRSDAVRQFAVNWYLKDQVKAENKENIRYSDETYDKALYQAILKAEEYLLPFFQYDIGSIYEIEWDDELSGGIDRDKATLSACQLNKKSGKAEYAFGISAYLPYGQYVIVEQQPWRAEWMDLENKHYSCDKPREISLPAVYEESGKEIPEKLSEKLPAIKVPWSVTEKEEDSILNGFAYPVFTNRKYRVRLRIEKLDRETGEPILHDSGVFALYRAEREENKGGSGDVVRYKTDQIIEGSRKFLEAMGAYHIAPFARENGLGVGDSYYGTVPAGTPVCKESDKVIFHDESGSQTGEFSAQSTVFDGADKDILEVAGYLETPEPVSAGVYVLAELKAPDGYVRSKPIPIEVYSDQVTYYTDGETEKKASVLHKYEDKETARIFVNDDAVSLEISKKKTEDTIRGMKLEGSLRYLENRRQAGEHIELVYENGIYQGYGYLIRKLDSAEDKNRYVSGAKMILYQAIELCPSGDKQDLAVEGLKVIRDRNGNVVDILVEEDHAGKQSVFSEKDGVWDLRELSYGDVPVLFYDMGGLKVLEKNAEGHLYGFGKDGGRIRITSDTESIYALKGGIPVFEICGGDFSELVYDERTRAFTKMDEETVIYHLDSGRVRDALVDGYTGLAYVERFVPGIRGREERRISVWPVTVLRDTNGAVIRRDKILTGRPGERNAGSSEAYITGTWESETGSLEKRMSPVLDENGLVRYYPAGRELYKTGEAVYDRDGEYLTYRYEELLEKFNRAAYYQYDKSRLYQETGNGQAAVKLQHRKGEAWIVPNIWISGIKSPQDPTETEKTWGKPDLLRRVTPGKYILEEMEAPKGYVRAFPMAVCVEENAKVQRVSLSDERIKVEIHKTDSEDQILTGARLALFKAHRVYTSDFNQYPKGYYFVKSSQEPACWQIEDPVDNHPKDVRAVWITGKTPKYLEGIPAGDYILEELDTPAGYLPSSMEIVVKETEELQSFVLKDDHIKLEIFKYEADKNGIKTALPWGFNAELTLYPAVLDPNGEVKIQDGRPLYEAEHPVDSWIAGRLGNHGTDMTRAYEEMFTEYRDRFLHFSWKDPYGGGSAKRVEAFSYGNGEIVYQVWEMEDGREFSVTVSEKKGSSLKNRATLKESVKDRYVFKYQIHKNRHALGSGTAESYDTADGIHRIDKIPAGKYVLVETKTPDGYKAASPQIINVLPIRELQRYSMENIKKQRYIDKRDKAGNQLAGAELSLYRAGEDGELDFREELLEDRWISGKEGRYDADDLADGKIPQGYGIGDMRLHEIPPLKYGSYYLVETRAPEYFITMQPLKIILNEETADVITAVNQMAEGRIEIRKTDSEWYEKPVPGAWFEIRNKRTEDTFLIRTDETGAASSPMLPTAYIDHTYNPVPYEYEVREVRSPEGYQQSDKIWRVVFTPKENDVLVYRIAAENDRTRLYISKSDFETGDFVPGAKLAIYKAIYKDGAYIPDGIALESWSSKKEPHPCIGKLSAGETYFLIEEEAPEGYLVSPAALFTISKDGSHVIEIAKGSGKIIMDTEESTGKLKTLSVLCRSVTGGRFVLKNREQVISAGEMHGVIEIPDQIPEGESLTVSQWVTFSDGSEKAIKNESFRVYRKAGGCRINVKAPVKTEYLLSDKNGRSIALWDGQENERKRIEGSLWTEGIYRLEERLVFDDGSRIPVERTDLGIGNRKAVDHLDMKDCKTEVRIRKTDRENGKWVPGAKLSIKDRNGKTIASWNSGEDEYLLSGILKPGEEYRLVEDQAPEGYWKEEDILFTVSEDGRIDLIRMEDRKKETEPPKEPEPPTKPDVPDRPKPPKEPEKPECPGDSNNPHPPVETPDGPGPGNQPELPTEPMKPEKHPGVITAKYAPSTGGAGYADLRNPGKIRGKTGIYVPKTGDSRNPLLYIGGMVAFIIAAAVILTLSRKKTTDKTKRRFYIFLFTAFLVMAGFQNINAWAEEMSDPRENGRNVKIYESPVFVGERKDLMPADVIEEDGKQYRLVSMEEKDAVREKEITYASADIPYLLEGSQKPPDTALITLKDEYAQSEYEREVPLLKVTEKDVFWSDDFHFPLTVTGYDADSFRIGETEIPAEADMIRYEDAFLEYLGLSADCYQINKIEWSGESYEKDGEKCRDGEAKGKKLVRSVSVKYGGQVEAPRLEGRQYVALYEEITRADTDTEETETTVSEETEASAGSPIDAEALQKISLAERVLSWIREYRTVISVSIFFLLFLLSALLLFFRTGKKGKYK